MARKSKEADQPPEAAVVKTPDAQEGTAAVEPQDDVSIDPPVEPLPVVEEQQPVSPSIPEPVELKPWHADLRLPRKVTVLAVTSRSPKGFWRCGMRFSKTPRLFRHHELTEEQATRLQNEPNLIARIIEIEE